MKHILLPALTIFTISVCASAQFPPDTLWMRTYVDGFRSACYDVQQTDDGGFISVGYNGFSVGYTSDIYLVKTDINGNAEWSKIFDWTITSRGYSVRQTDDGGYIVAGYTVLSDPDNEDIYLIKTDALGDTLWTKVYGTPDRDLTYEVQQTSDGGYIVTGFTTDYVTYVSNAFLLKTDANGDSVWMRIYDDRQRQIKSVIQNDDGDYLIAGTSEVTISNWNATVMKTDSFGDTIWNRYYGGNNDERANCVRETEEGGYIIAGESLSYSVGLFDMYLIRINSEGDTLWTRAFGGEEHEYGESVDITDDGGFIMAGMSNSFGYFNFYLVRTNSSGDSLWTMVIALLC